MNKDEPLAVNTERYPLYWGSGRGNQRNFYRPGASLLPANPFRGDDGTSRSSFSTPKRQMTLTRKLIVIGYSIAVLSAAGITGVVAHGFG